MPIGGPFRICFVCTGNICRSPTAEVVLTALAHERGLEGALAIDSAGTGDWHIGERADARALRALAAGGYSGEYHRARQFERPWFADIDLVVALDRGHARVLRAWAGTEQNRAKVRLLRSFDPALSCYAPHGAPLGNGHGETGELDIADPYYDGESAFGVVLGQIESACQGLLAHVEKELAERTFGRGTPVVNAHRHEPGSVNDSHLGSDDGA